VSLAEHPAVARARYHTRLSTLVERLIRILDDLDGDPDLEPSLSHPEVPSRESQLYSANWLPIGGPQFSDLEEACEDEGAITGDDEPEDSW